MKVTRKYYNPTWRETITAANWLAFANEEREREAIITVGDETFKGTTDQDINSLVNEKGYPTGTEIKVSKEYLAPGPFPTRPIKETITIAIYEVL